LVLGLSTFSHNLCFSSHQGAKSAILESLSLWLPRQRALLENRPPPADANGGATVGQTADACPLLYTTRVAAAKILIELELWDEASEVLDGLVEEDDSVVEAWYLLGWLNRLRATAPNGDVAFDGNARFYLQKARDVHKISPTDDQDMIAHIEELLEELGHAEDEEEGVEESNGKTPEEEWETTDEEEEEMDQA
jgi:hypothetical protein